SCDIGHRRVGQRLIRQAFEQLAAVGAVARYLHHAADHARVAAALGAPAPVAAVVARGGWLEAVQEHEVVPDRLRGEAHLHEVVRGAILAVALPVAPRQDAPLAGELAEVRADGVAGDAAGTRQAAAG